MLCIQNKTENSPLLAPWGLLLGNSYI